MDRHVAYEGFDELQTPLLSRDVLRKICSVHELGDSEHSFVARCSGNCIRLELARSQRRGTPRGGTQYVRRVTA
jgi:hypothetical protein